MHDPGLQVRRARWDGQERTKGGGPRLVVRAIKDPHEGEGPRRPAQPVWIAPELPEIKILNLPLKLYR